LFVPSYLSKDRNNLQARVGWVSLESQYLGDLDLGFVVYQYGGGWGFDSVPVIWLCAGSNIEQKYPGDTRRLWKS